MNEFITPAELSRELAVDQRRIRAFLRTEFGKLLDQQQTRWRLTNEQADDVRANFRRH